MNPDYKKDYYTDRLELSLQRHRECERFAAPICSWLESNDLINGYRINKSGCGSESTYISFWLAGACFEIRISCHDNPNDTNVYYRDYYPPCDTYMEFINGMNRIINKLRKSKPFYETHNQPRN